MTRVFPNEPNILSQYLLGKSCPAPIAADYALAISKLEIQLTGTQQKTYERMLHSPFLLRSIDSGLALVKSQSNIRKRIFVMLALLECTTENTVYFLPQPRSIFYFFIIGLRVARGFFFAVIGLVLIKLLSIE